MKTICTSLLLLIIFTQCNVTRFDYPLINIFNDSITDIYFNHSLKDPYRELENSKDSNVVNWLKAQEKFAKSITRNITGWEQLKRKQKLFRGNNLKVWLLNITPNNIYFYTKQDTNETYSQLYFRNGFNGKEELLLDPKDYKVESKINYIKPSWDGTKLVISFTKNDEEISELVIMDVQTKKLYPQTLTNCWPTAIGGVSWLSNNTGFFYVHIPDITKKSKNYIQNTQSVLYKLGTNPLELNVILSKKHNPELKIKPEDFPIISSHISSPNFLFSRMGGVGIFEDNYYASIENGYTNLKWKPLFKQEDKVIQFFIRNDEIIYKTAKEAPNYKICKTSLKNPDFKNPQLLVEEDSSDVITDFAVNSEGIFYVKTKNGIEANLFQFKNNEIQRIKLPKKSGDVDLTTISTLNNELWVEISGWTSKSERYRLNIEKNSFEEEMFYTKAPYSRLDDAVVEEVEVESYDGVKVPLSIIYKKGTKLNGKNRVLMAGYGAYGYSWTPYLQLDLLNWLDNGGVYAVAHVRGGGEKGDNWRKGGYKTTKHNTWKDFIACTEYLIDKGYTSPNKMAVWSGSAGGILIGRAITERPDLYAAAIINVGICNTTRFEFGPNGKNNIKEFGTIKDSLEFVALFEMDSYQHVEMGKKYPAIHLTAGMNDPRVPYWQPAKFAAKLQESNSSNRPILLSVDFEGGHGKDGSNSKFDEETTDVITFALWQTGHPDYQLKK